MPQPTVAQPARMSDVAKLAGFSTMTVSRVLNANPYVLEETRQRVLAAVEQLSYQRNELARSLRERRSRQIGILVPNLYDPFFALCAHAINAVAKAHSYSVNIATTDEDPKAEFAEASRMLLRHVEGLVVIPAEGATAGPSRLLSPEFERLAIVTLDRPLALDRYLKDASRVTDTLLVENKAGAQLGTTHLLSLGHTRVAFVALERKLYTMRMRYEGYRAAMKKAGLPEETILVSGESAETQAVLIARLSVQDRPTALFSANNLVTREVLHCLHSLGIHPPETMALAGFDDFEIADLLRPGITVVQQPIEELARQAAESLFARLQRNVDDPPTPGKRIVLPVRLIVRGSCGATVGP